MLVMTSETEGKSFQVIVASHLQRSSKVTEPHLPCKPEISDDDQTVSNWKLQQLVADVAIYSRTCWDSRSCHQGSINVDI